MEVTKRCVLRLFVTFNWKYKLKFSFFSIFRKAKAATPDSQKDELASDVSNDVVKPLEVGDSLPVITLKNEKGEDVNVAEIANEGGVVMFLVPKADTRKCRIQ